MSGRRYSRYKMFRFPEKLGSLPEEEARLLAPIHVRIKPTNVCGHHCTYCAYRSDNLDLGSTMTERDQIPKPKMFEILHDLEAMSVKAVTFSGGGDPFYYKHLLDVVKWLSGSSIQFATLTNGARLNGELAEVFSEHGTWVRVSIDGWDDDSYARYRGIRRGEFTKLMNNLTAFSKLDGTCHLGVSVIVDHQNVTHLEGLIKQLSDVGVDSVKISPCVVSNSGVRNNEYHGDSVDYIRDMVARLSMDIKDPSFEIFNAYHRFSEKFDKPYKWCPYQQLLTVIGADLNVYTCQDKAYTSSGYLGSIKNIRFRDFWFQSKTQFFKIDPRVHCSHHCVAADKNVALIEYLEGEAGHQVFV